MKTTAVRLYGALDLRLERFELPEITDDELLLRVESDTICASTYKAVKLGSQHKRVPADIAENPIIIGHEICGTVARVGKNLRNEWKVGQNAVIQPAIKLENGHDPGYSYPYIGGSATYAVVPKVFLDRGCFIPYAGDAFFKGSLVEPLSCILRACKASYHTDSETYERYDGLKRGGRLAILGGAGPMGIGAVELAIGYSGVSQVVVTDINAERLADCEAKLSPASAKKKGVDLIYLNTAALEHSVEKLRALSCGGFDDVIVMAPVPALFTMAEEICATDGCVNFFAGPAIKNLPASLNIYRIHYDGIHVVGTTGGIPQDTRDVIDLIEQNKIDPNPIISHILGLDDVIGAVLAMEKPSGLKKVCYPHLAIPMAAVSEFGELGKKDPLFAKLDQIVKANGGVWCAAAEKYLLEHAPRID